MMLYDASYEISLYMLSWVIEMWMKSMPICGDQSWVYSASSHSRTEKIEMMIEIRMKNQRVSDNNCNIVS
jgi:hypothetical protein